MREVVSAAEAAGCALCRRGRDGQARRARRGWAAGLLLGAPDLCIVLGGDGTILKAMRAYAGTEVPVFGFNFGTVGFLAAVRREELGTGLARALAGEFEVLEMPGLEATTDVETPLALNDVSLIRRPHGRVAELLRLGGKEVGHVRCDGLVAATPAGSRATTSPTRGRSSPGGRGLRGQLHRAAHAHRAPARGRAVRRALGDQRRGPGPSRHRSRRRARRRAREAAPTWTSASGTPSAAWPSCRARTSTAGSATSSAGSRGRKRASRRSVEHRRARGRCCSS